MDAKQKATVKAAKMLTKVFLSADEKLAFHLEQAEAHLIAAAELFLQEQKPDRHHDFVSRLTRAQELVTWLYREELIRIRGPIKIRR